jgi:hypothetical protein
LCSFFVELPPIPRKVLNKTVDLQEFPHNVRKAQETPAFLQEFPRYISAISLLP